MIRHNDAIQVDRTVYKFRTDVVELRARNTELEQAVAELLTKLRNKPDAPISEGVPQSPLVVKVTKGRSIDLNISIIEWTPKHFIKYFQQKYKKLYNANFSVTGKAWAVYIERIRRFRGDHPDVIDNQDYKNFIDWAFEEKFTVNFIANIPLIASDALLNQWNVKNAPTRTTDWKKFDSLINKLPKSSKSTDELLKDAF